MCGIAGIIGDFHPGLVARMNAAQVHRGPDGEGVFEDPQAEVALGHVRLSILDLSDAAAQPMKSPCERYTLVYNGEIYNFRDLREQLPDTPESYRSSGDTEVLLKGLIREGEAFVSKLNGIFAFAFWDAEQQQLLLARDHLGIKPLYLHQTSDGELAFASEMKALLQHPKISKEIDPLALQQHLLFCHACDDRTILKGVRRLPAGSTLVWKQSQSTIRPYWQPRYGGENKSQEECTKRLANAIDKAVQRQMVSDASIGTFLSGGLDSTLIATISAKTTSQFDAFTTVLEGENQLDGMQDDAPFARQVAKQLGLKHHEISLQSRSTDLLPKLVYHLDEPIVDPAIVNCYLVSQRAREMGIKVLLSGQGADELFGGYPRYRAMQMAQKFSGLPTTARRAIGSLSTLIPGAWGGTVGPTLRRARRLLSEIAFPEDERFLRYCCQTRPEQIMPLLSGDMTMLGLEPFEDCSHLMDQVNGPNRFLHRDMSVYLPNHNLLYTDKMGMATGVETRVPLLDIELVELSHSMPFSWKVNRELKHLLRSAARKHVPAEIIDRKKAGFGAPFRGWLRNELSDVWNDVSHPDSINRRGWFDAATVAGIREESQSGRSDLYLLQWAIMTLELWARQFLDRAPGREFS